MPKINNRFMPKLVFTIHGAFTHAKWQKSVGEVFHLVHNIDYGFLNIIQFIIPYYRNKLIDHFHKSYLEELNKKSCKANLNDHNKFPSIIAHSFGSYILGYCMQKYPDVKFDKIILCGSILPVDYDWHSLISSERIHYIRNETSPKDLWVKIVHFFVSKTGPSGAVGFSVISNYVFQERYSYFHHSNYLNIDHMKKYWKPFLEKKPPNYTIKNGREIGSIDEFQRIFQTTTLFDDEEYGMNTGYKEVEVSDEQALKWVKLNPDIYTFMFSRGDKQPVGYLNAMPLNDIVFSKLKEGQIQDNQITDLDIMTYENNSKVKLYIMSIAIDKRIRLLNNGLYSEPFEILINGFLLKMLSYAIDKKIVIQEIVAIGWTEYGKRMCGIFGMEHIATDKLNHPVYYTKFDINKLNELKSKYNIIAKIIDEYKKIQ